MVQIPKFTIQIDTNFDKIKSDIIFMKFLIMYLYLKTAYFGVNKQIIIIKIHILIIVYDKYIRNVSTVIILISPDIEHFL